MSKANQKALAAHGSSGAFQSAFSDSDARQPAVNARLYALLDQLVAIRLDLTHGATPEQGSASGNGALELMIQRIDAVIVATKEIVDALETGPLGEARHHQALDEQPIR